MSLRDELYLELYPEYAPKFERNNLDFNKHYHDLFDKTYRTGDKTFKELLVESLDAILAKYADSEPSTKAGGVLRKIAGFLGYLLPFLKFIKFKK